MHGIGWYWVAVACVIVQENVLCYRVELPSDNHRQWVMTASNASLIQNQSACVLGMT